MAVHYLIDQNETHQRIAHFGASGAWSLDPVGKLWSAEGKNKIAELLFSRDTGIGLSVWRFAIGSGGAAAEADYPEPMGWRGHTETFKRQADAVYDWTAHEGQRWFMKAAKDYGVDSFIAMSYAPPVWMSKNGRIAPDESSGQSNLAEERFDEYARWLADVLEHFEQEGLPFAVISPLNEPSWSWNDSKQEGNRYSNAQIKAIVRALHRELTERGLSASIDVPESAEIAALLDDTEVRQFQNWSTHYTGHDNGAHYGGKYGEYIKDFLGDPEFAGLVGNKLSYHSYWADHVGVEDRLTRYRLLLKETMRRHAPLAELWQTEYCNLNPDGPGMDLGMDMALFTAKVIHHDLTIAGVSSWQWWLAVSPHDYKDGLIYTNYTKYGDPETVLPSKTLWALGHYSRFIRPGAMRISCFAATDNPHIMASAFIHQMDLTFTMVVINDGEAAEEVSFDGPYLPEQFKLYLTSEQEGDLRLTGQTGRRFSAPGRSIVTLSADL